MEKVEDTYKVVVLGESRVGKTSITMRFCRNEFDEKSASTLNAFYLEQNIRINNPKNVQATNTYKLCIWDTAGQEIHHALNAIYYRNAQGALIVYDITDVDSFKKMSDWVKELRTQVDRNLPIIVVANKSDLESNRQIALEEGENYARSLGVDHYSASARTGHNIKEIFKKLTERIAGGTKKQKKVANMRGGFQVQGYDVSAPDDDDNVFGERKNTNGFQLRKSVADGKGTGPGGKKKKSGCC